MIGGRDHDCVDLVAHLVEELPIVLELCGGRKSLRLLAEVATIDIAQRDDVLLRELIEVVTSLACNSDDGQIQFFIRRLRVSNCTIGHADPPRSGSRCGSQKLTSANTM